MNEKQVITRSQALKAGLGKYFTGKPCVNGHIAERYTQSGTCKHCINPPTEDENGVTGRQRYLAKFEEDRKYRMKFLPIEARLPQAVVSEIIDYVVILAKLTWPEPDEAYICPAVSPKKPVDGWATYKFFVHISLHGVFEQHVKKVIQPYWGKSGRATPEKALASLGVAPPVDTEPDFSEFDNNATAILKAEAEAEAAARPSYPPPPVLPSTPTERELRMAEIFDRPLT